MQSGVKVRQPLARMLLYLEQESDKEIIRQNQAILLEELNVKKIDFLRDSADILEYRIKANLPRIGKRLGAQVRTVQNYLLRGSNVNELLQELKTNGYITIPNAAPNANSKKSKSESLPKNKNSARPKKSSHQQGQAILLSFDDLLIESNISQADTAGVESNGIFAALETKLTPELIAEGYARDLVRNIQELRKSSGLAVSDRIHLRIRISQNSPHLAQTLQSFSDYIASETLAESLKITAQAPPPQSILPASSPVSIFKRALALDKERVEIELSNKR